ncbi:cupin domain-containing protein [Streptomyces sp. DSM 41524]|uniref:Cupin domain-containing protein n=1 Tax=Streptomyces asiaticus subsp. ignotus TaxID=3098222 RepID=A0ABU7QC35_9ACTN|nr:cupin domain-containing protein [Streptomyces sp. DSM 41524]
MDVQKLTATEDTGPVRLVDLRDAPARENHLWPVHIVRRAEIEHALGLLAEGEPGADGCREFSVVHPNSVEPGLGLAPGIDVVFGVLLPGEETVPVRHNASSVSMCLSGHGVTDIDESAFATGFRDVWVTPSMSPFVLRNPGDEPFIYLTYSNRPMLRKLEVYFREEKPPVGVQAPAVDTPTGGRVKDLAPGFPIGDSGAWLLPYEHLIDPEFVESRPLLWKWQDVAPHLGLLKSLKTGYTGRPLMCLYNPATGTRNGTTANFFATISNGSANLIGPAHRHSSAAINYILDGSGWSVVDGVRIDWEAGDIMLSAPGWAPHGHARGPEGASILTIQDHPLQIASESLVWQEDLEDGPILSLGKQAGFQTNLSQFLADTE